MGGGGRPPHLEDLHRLIIREGFNLVLQQRDLLIVCRAEQVDTRAQRLRDLDVSGPEPVHGLTEGARTPLLVLLHLAGHTVELQADEEAGGERRGLHAPREHCRRPLRPVPVDRVAVVLRRQLCVGGRLREGAGGGVRGDGRERDDGGRGGHNRDNLGLCERAVEEG